MSAEDRRPRSRAERVISAMIRLFPFDFRADYGRDLEQTFRVQHREARREKSVGAWFALWGDVLRDVAMTAPREHLAILRQDTGYALRALRRAPVFAVSAVLTLALGMSAMTAMIAVMNAVMFRPLPVERPEELISISNQTGDPFGLSYPDLQDYRARTDVLVDAIGYAPRPGAINVDGTSDRITMELVTDNYFSMLGVMPAAGRLIQPNEGRVRGDAPVLVLAHAYWVARFGGDPSVVGRLARINGRPFTIIGVTSPSFRSTESLVRISAFVPAWMYDVFSDAPAALSRFEDRNARMFTVLARLKPGVSLAEARAALDVRAAALARDFPLTHKDVSLRVVPETHTRPTPQFGAALRVASTVLAGLAALVLLITSANVANLLLARGASRGREVALRSALGARRGRIMRQFLTEGMTLALLGAVVAIPIVIAAMRALMALVAGVSSVVVIDPDFSVDLRVIGAVLVMAIGSGVVAGLAPAIWACRADPGQMVKSGARAGLDRSSGRLRGALVVVQVALSLALLVCGGLLVRSLGHARNVHLGFEPDGMFLSSVIPGPRYDAGNRLAFYQNVRAKITSLPDVEQAAWISLPPLGIIGEIAQVTPDVKPADPDWRPPIASEVDVSPDYFTTAHVRLVQGRGFEERDSVTSTPVVVINETLAAMFWPNQNPIGRTLTADGRTLEIIGVVQNGKYRNINETPQPAIFNALHQTTPSLATLAVRTARPSPALASTIRQVIRQIDPDVSVFDVRSMTTHLDNGMAFFVYRVGAFMTSLFGAMGMLLAAVGLYGTISYHVSQRTQEIGVRMALGACAADIIRDVLSHGGRFAVLGIAAGAALSAALAQLLQGVLLGVSSLDPLTYLAVAGMLVAICLMASFIPARRATALDPLKALRAE
jgi:predicted permease